MAADTPTSAASSKLRSVSFGANNEASSLLQNTGDERSNETAVPQRKKSSLHVPLHVRYEDIPVLCMCPHCDEKIVTRTHFEQGASIWCCCCCFLPLLLDVFKDVVHTCPRCKETVAVYNRFDCCRRFKDNT